MNGLAYILMVVWWVHGIAVAKGFWLVTLCIFLPPASFVVSMSWLMERFA